MNREFGLSGELTSAAENTAGAHSGIFTALVTPFLENGEIDYLGVERLLEKQLEAGIHGIVPCGTSGESATLSANEHYELIQFVSSYCSGKAIVCAGTGTNSTAQSVERTQAAEKAGADSALVITPYYNKPSPDGLVAHYKRIAQVGMPIVAYNVPSRTGCHLDLECYSRLSEIDQVFACKEASGCLNLAEQVLQDTNLQLLSGDDALSFPLLSLGASGVVSVCSNIIPGPMVELYYAIQRSDLERARALHFEMLKLMRGLFWDTNPAPVKYLLSNGGLIENELRLPLVECSKQVQSRLDALVQDLDLVLIENLMV